MYSGEDQIHKRKVFEMKRKNQKCLFVGVLFIVLFVLWTVLLKCVDVKDIGPCGSSVGLATVNGIFHSFTGVNMYLYTITDILSIVPFVFMFGFGTVGLVQSIRRRSVFKVDISLLCLGIFYITVMAVYIFFEMYTVNFRPILIDGILEASYPSSTTMLVTCVMPTSIMQLNDSIGNKSLKRIVSAVLIAFTVFMVAGRLVSGVHWLTDIVGGAFVSFGLVMIYCYAVGRYNDNKTFSTDTD